MALYSMYPASSSHLMYQDSPQRNRQQTLQSQLGYYSDQHGIQQPQGLGLSDGTPTYARSYATAYDQMPMGYPMTQPTAYTSSLPMTEDLHHGYPYSRLMQSGLLPGMSDEADTASRPRLTAEQTRELEALYAANNKPSTQQKQEYAQRFRLTKNRVDNWFQNRRAKSKHQNKAKQAELAMTNLAKTETDSSSKDTSKGSSYDTYNAYNEDMSSQNTAIDMMASTSYSNDQGQELVSPDDCITIDEDSWDSNNGEMAYGHNPEFANHQLLSSEACSSPSPISLKSFDHKNTAAAYQLPSHLANEYPSEAYTRRGSTLSDLASHMNGIRMPSDHATEMYGAEPPRRGLGDRRPQRPAALTNMRSTSGGIALRSPLLMETNASQSLRRINTCGTPLNKTGRIQKYGGSSTPQRSPRALSQALERAMDQFTPQIDAESLTPEQHDTIDRMIDEKEAADGVIFNVNPPSSEATWVENTNVDFGVPPLSASLTGDDGSPPITPLPGQGTFTNPWTGQEMSTVTSTALPSYVHTSMHDQSQCIAPQPQHSLHHFWDGAGMNDVYSMSSAYDFAQANISRPASLGPHYTYGSISRRSEPLKIEFSHPYRDAQPHYYVPLRENQNYVFHEYNPDNARRE